MKYCDKCKVSVRSKQGNCPLCQNLILDSEQIKKDFFIEDTSAFPFIPTIYHQYNLFFRMIIFISIIIGVACLSINVIFPFESWWSFFVIGGIFCMWISLALIIQKRHNILKTIFWLVAVSTIASFIWDYFTTHSGWSINYVIPSICTIAMIVMGIIAKVMKLHVGDYLIYLVMDAIFCILPVILYLIGYLNVVYPSIICIAAGIISLAGLLLFEGENMRSEIKKRIHL